MERTDSALLRGAVVPTAVAGVVAGAVAAVIGGVDAAIGAVAGAILVIGFFSTSVLAVGWVAKRDTFATLPVAMFTYFFKITLLAVVLVAFRDTMLFDPVAFGIGVLVATVCWLIAMTRAVATAKILYVDPAETDRPL
jgi:ATP synthase protein I